MSRIYPRPISPTKVARRRKKYRSSSSRRAEQFDSDSEHDSTGDEGEDEAPLHFPHAPVSQTGFEHPTGYAQPHIKSKHVDILNATLHKSLLTRDWDRASRAFGLLLRSSLSNKRLDLREKGQWGIGAEILLKRNSSAQKRQTDQGGDRDVTQDLDETWFTAKGFENARTFYERLILQYPYSARHPNAVNENTFYPVMLRLWIMHVQLERQRAEIRIAPSAHAIDDQEDRGKRTKIARKQLIRAREISEEIGRLASSRVMGFTDNFRELQSQVDRWIADLEQECESREAATYAIVDHKRAPKAEAVGQSDGLTDVRDGHDTKRRKREKKSKHRRQTSLNDSE